MIHLPIIIILTASLTLGVFCQNKPSSSELKDKSSLTESLTRLSQIIPQSQVGLESNFPDPETDEVITDERRYSESVEFSRGFKLSKIDGCKITLTSDNAKLVSFWTKNPDPKKGSFQQNISSSTFPARLIIMLNNLSEEGGKRPFESRKKGTRASGWRVEYRIKNGWFFPLRLPTKEEVKKALQNLPLKATLTGSGENGRNESMTGDRLLLLFDSKDKAEEFDTLFRSTVRQCQ